MIEKRYVKVNSNLEEDVEYSDRTFPILSEIDDFDHLLNEEFNCHWHEDLEFTIVVKGTLEYNLHRADGHIETRILQAGDGVFVNAGGLHSATQKEPGTIAYYCVFPAEIFKLQPTSNIYKNAILPILQMPISGLFFMAKDQKDSSMLHAMKKFFEIDSKKPTTELQIFHTLCEIWLLLFEKITILTEIPVLKPAEKRQEDRVRIMLSYIHENYMKQITIEDISSAANVSRSECFRCFQKIVGKSPIKYLLEYRIFKASLLLRNTEMSIENVGNSVGFLDESYFIKAFHRQMHLSPGKYRKNEQKEIEDKIYENDFA